MDFCTAVFAILSEHRENAFDDVVHAVCGHLRELFDCERCGFFLVDKLSDELLVWCLRL